MCYSAQIEADYRKYVKRYGADIGIAEFVRLYWDRSQGAKIKIPKAMDAAFANPQSDDERRIKTLIDEFNALQVVSLEQDIFKQRKRLADAVRSLESKETKAARENLRIATSKVEWGMGKLASLRRPELLDEDSRIFPGWYAPVLVVENGRKVVKPMRYQCRPAGKPAFNDVKLPGTYNARRDSLDGFWKGLFGYSHGIIIANAFFENVSRHTMEHRDLAAGEKEENVILEFRPTLHWPRCRPFSTTASAPTTNTAWPRSRSVSLRATARRSYAGMPITYSRDFYGSSPLVYVELNGRRIAHYKAAGASVTLRWYHMDYRADRSTEHFDSIDAARAACEAFERGLDIEPWGETYSGDSLPPPMPTT